MKIAISGKGGVGKTTLSALLAHSYAKEGRRVLAVDADPDANLGLALGFPLEALEGFVPIARMDELIMERTGARRGDLSQWFSLNPRVEDIPERCCLSREGIRLLVMGGVEKGGGGCACPENILLKHLLRHLFLEREDVVIVDMEAGLEHLGRGTAEGVDAFLVVVEPGCRSFQTARAVASLAGEIGVKRVWGVANKVRGPEDETFIARALEGIPVLGALPYDPQATQADLEGKPIYAACPLLVRAAGAIKAKLEYLLKRA